MEVPRAEMLARTSHWHERELGRRTKITAREPPPVLRGPLAVSTAAAQRPEAVVATSRRPELEASASALEGLLLLALLAQLAPSCAASSQDLTQDPL